jgi:alkylation response protein AidB-like acyl-CoA dehydrogenase
MIDHLDRLRAVIDAEVEPNAIHVDADGTFPNANIDALTSAGLLGIVSAESVGGEGLGPAAATAVVGELARHCSSTAMIVCMHYAATAVIEAVGTEDTRRAIAENRHLSTLAFSEQGSRSHFWAPLSTAAADGDAVVLDAHKSWVTGAGEADSYVWSSMPLAADGASTLWLVPSDTPGLKIDAPFDGLGLRGNGSSPVSAAGASIPAANRLGPDGGGFDLMIGTVLPWFNLMNSALSVGLMDAAVARSAEHLMSTRLEHLDETLADAAVNRLHLARAKVRTDQAAALLAQAVAAVESGADDAVLRVLETKVSAGDAAIEVTDLCMRVCGGSAFRKEVGVERLFRDARAAAVMAPTSDTLYDFIGKAVCGLPLF